MSLSHVVRLGKMSESFTGPPARRLIQQAGLLQTTNGPLVVLDNACGTGVVSSLMYEMLDEDAKERLQLTCGDFSQGMVQSVQQRIVDSGWKGAKAQVVDAQVLGISSSNLVSELIHSKPTENRFPRWILHSCSDQLWSYAHG